MDTMHRVLFPHDMRLYEHHIMYYMDKHRSSVLSFLQPFLDTMQEPLLNEWYDYVNEQKNKYCRHREVQETSRTYKEKRVLVRKLYRLAKSNDHMLHFIDVLLLYCMARHE